VTRPRYLVAVVGPLLVVGVALATPLVSWEDSGDHGGRLVTVEGYVAEAETRDRTCILRFDADDEAALTVLLLVPLVTSLPPLPHRLYEGRRIRATGRIQRFGGRLEMVLQSPDQIEVLGLTADAEPRHAEPPVPADAAPHPAAPAPTAAPARGPAAPAVEPAAPLRGPAAPAIEPAAPTLEPAAPAALPSAAELACARARQAWEQAHLDARDAVAELSTCLDAGRSRCAPLGDRLGPVLTDLEWAEQRLETTCPPRADP